MRWQAALLAGEWTDDTDQLLAAGVPETIQFKRQWEIGIDLLDRLGSPMARSSMLEGLWCNDRPP